ncbi:MAG TPA: Wzt carbohydrate-binding domain-containing protein, partial [Solirubrobacterales bacterium]
HDTAAVEGYCHRAMLINGGNIEYIGAPDEVGRRYLKLNFEHGTEDAHALEKSTGDEVRIVDTYLDDTNGNRASAVEQGAPIRMRLELEALRDLAGLDIGLVVVNADGLGVTRFDVTVGEFGAREIGAGQRVMIEAELENPLGPGRYFVHCGINRAFGEGVALYVHNALDFVVYGNNLIRGMVAIPFEATARIDDDR